MVKKGSHRSVQEHKSSVAAINSGDVLVVAARQSDAATLCEILSRAGYEPHWYSDPLQLCNLPSSARLIGLIMAIVLCHRTRLRDHETGPNVINMPSQLPGQLRCKRVIAVSDCMAEQTIISLLDDGAHHCFNLLETPRLLEVRLEAALRRHGRPREKFQVHGDIQFDIQKRRVTRSGCVIGLSPKEYELAYYLFSNRDRVVENGELLASIWSLPAGMDTRRIDTAACRVRKKLRLTAEHGWELKRLRRIGYQLVRAHDGQDVESAVDSLQET